MSHKQISNLFGHEVSPRDMRDLHVFCNLTPSNWQNLKKKSIRSLSCHCHEIDRVEEVGLKSSNKRPTLKFVIFVSM